MFTAINVGQTKRITLPSDPDKKNPTFFTIVPLDALQRAHIKDSISHDDGRIDMFMLAIELVRFGLKKVENYAGQTIEFTKTRRDIGGVSYTAVDDEFLAGLGDDLITDLSKAVSDAAKLSEDERKN